MEDSPRYRRDLRWNLAAIAILGLSGIALNLAIGAVHGSSALGVFNQALTCYLLASQLSVGGLYFSTLHYCAADRHEAQPAGAGLLPALSLGAVQATAACALLYLLAHPIARFLDSPATEMALLTLLPGLWCLTLNKILLAALNGYRCMRLFATLNSLRYVAMVLALGWLLQQKRSPETLTWCLTVAEIVLLPLLLLTVGWQGYLKPTDFTDWSVKHLKFGGRSIVSGLLLDANTRVDLVVLGYLCSDEVVGVFSCAALFAEGFYHILIAVQSNTTPLLTNWPAQQRYRELTAASKKLKTHITPWLFLLWIVSVPIYAPLIESTTGSATLASGWSVYALVGLGFVLISNWFPLFFALNQWGFPSAFAGQLMLMFVTNLALNLILVPLHQADGAALATAISWSLSVVYFRWLARRVTGL